MPCWEVNTMNVDLIASDRDLLEQALKTLGYRYYRYGNDFEMGNMGIKGNKIYGNDMDRVNAIRRQYSIETVKKIAKAKKWVGAWKMTGHQKTGNKVVLKKY